MHAAQIMARTGWRVHVLSSPERNTASLEIAPIPNVTHHATLVRPLNIIRPRDYLGFLTKACSLAWFLQPSVIYASDPLATAPAIAAAQFSRATLVYHEHDTPPVEALRSWIALSRRAVARKAKVLVIPNLERGRVLCMDTEQPSTKVRIVWNTPLKSELPPPVVRGDECVNLYFHGSITPDRLPEAVIYAVCRFEGRVRLSIAGYEAPGAAGYLARLLALGTRPEGPLVIYLGQIPRRENLLRTAANFDVGLALMPKDSSDLNMRHMVGASNKPFDYMAAGLAILVSDLPDWTRLFCNNGFGRSCDPSNADSIAFALRWFLDHPTERRAMGETGRQKIRNEWNYDTGFAGVLDELDHIVTSTAC